jgi:phosphoserine phosphatase
VHGQIGWRQWASATTFCLRWWPVYGRHVFKKNKAYLAGLTALDIENCAERFVRDILTRYLRPSVLQRLERHREAGEPIALLTGTPDFIARPLARYIGAHAFSATECAVCDGRFSGEPPPVHPFGVEKLARAQRLCEQVGWRLSDCVAYADSIQDLALLCRVSRPVVVHPDRPLRALAQRAGWEIIPR